MSIFQTKYRYIYILLLSVYSYLNIKFTEGDVLFNEHINDLGLAAIILGFVILIWEGNRLLSIRIQDKSSPKSRHRPLVLLFLIATVWIGIISLLGFLVTDLIVVTTSSATFKLMIGFNFRINLFLHCINAIVYYRKQGHDFQIEAERFKKRSAEAQFDALRKQVNPHFLFNSFNVLSTLIYQDPDVAAKFVEQLSKVYRYLLKNQDNRLVKLEEELNFLDAYTYLMKIRFRDNIIIENSIEDHSRQQYIAPSALQLLIENAIKHNEVSRRSPLSIKLYSNNGHLVVENNIQLKEQKVESSNVGLNNIVNRYSFLSKENPVIVNSNGVFTVKIPLIKVEESE